MERTALNIEHYGSVFHRFPRQKCLISVHKVVSSGSAAGLAELSCPVLASSWDFMSCGKGATKFYTAEQIIFIDTYSNLNYVLNNAG